MGKTTIIIDIAADLSRQGQYTLFITKEEQPGPLKARMLAAKGEVDKLLFYGNRTNGAVEYVPPNKLDDAELTKLENTVRHYAEAGTPISLIAIEPLSDFIDGNKYNSDPGIRELLSRLSLLANRHKAMIIPSVHWTKNTDLRIRDRIMGSVGIINVARSVNVLLRDEQEGRRLLINLINNYGRDDEENCLGYRLASRMGTGTVS
jgi:hypothetical protein